MRPIAMPAIILLVSFLLLMPTPVGTAPETWTEMKSGHFTVWSNAGDRETRDLVWQLEQIRFAVATLWPWAQLEIAKPMRVLIVKDEQAMKALAPGFWEQKGGVRPASVWVPGADQYYMAIRADVRGEEGVLVNAYTSAYFSYVNLVLTSSFGRDLPLWFSRGMAGVLSNTIIQGKEILLGPVIPWHLERLQSDSRMKLKDLINVTRSSREYMQGAGLERFDAQAWALVHFLMFGQNGARLSAINKFAAFLDQGKDPEPAFVEAFGRVEDLENGFALYINRRLYTYKKFVLNQQIKKEQFTSRTLPAAESLAGRAAFHVAMRRLDDARPMIAEAHKADPNYANAYLAEALLLQRDNQPDGAKAAFLKAASLGSPSAYVYYRAAMSMWEAAGTDDAALRQIETYLAHATELNPLSAESYAALAEVRSALKLPPADIIALLNKAVKLDPSDAWLRISAARTLWRLNNVEDARKVARVALALAGDDERAKTEADRLLATIPERK